MTRLKLFTALFDTLHSIARHCRSGSLTTRSARFGPSLLSPQNSPGPGASSSRVMSRLSTSWNWINRKRLLTSSSCCLLALLRRLVPTRWLATRTADETTAISRSRSVAVRPASTHGKRNGSIALSTDSRTRSACSWSVRSALAESVDDANVLRSSSEIGGAARYRNAMRLLRSDTISVKSP